MKSITITILLLALTSVAWGRFAPLTWPSVIRCAPVYIQIQRTSPTNTLHITTNGSPRKIALPAHIDSTGLIAFRTHSEPIGVPCSTKPVVITVRKSNGRKIATLKAYLQYNVFHEKEIYLPKPLVACMPASRCCIQKSDNQKMPLAILKVGHCMQ